MKSRVPLTLIIISFVCIFALPPVVGQTTTDWPMFHYDLQRNGVTANTTNTSTPNSLLWSYTADDTVTSPAIVNGRVYVGSADSYYCIDAITGVQIWKYKTNGLISGDPSVAKGVVYFGSNDGNLYAIDADTGLKIWNKEVGWIAGTPTIVGNRLFVGANNIIYCLDTTNGNEIWNYSTPEKLPGNTSILNAVYASTAVSEGRVYAVAQDGIAYCLNATQGDLLWKFQTGDLSESSPAVVDGRVFFGSNDGYLYCVDVKSGKLNWSFQTSGFVNSSPAVAGGKVYFGSGDQYVYCVDALTGTKVWSYQTGGFVYSSPAVASGKVYIGSFDDYFYALDASSGNLFWKYQTGNEIWSSPAVSNGIVYVGSNDHKLYAFSTQYVSGVKAGDWFRYAITTTGNVGGEWAGLDQLTLNVDNLDTSGKLLTCHLTAHYLNGTEISLPTYQVNIESGIIDPVGSTSTVIGKIGLVAANLAAGDSIYNSQTWRQYVINETIWSTPPSGSYDILISSSDSMAPSIPKGNYIIVDKSVNTADLNANYPDSDIIVFHNPTNNSQLIVHRIVAKEVINGKVQYYVKGDNNGAKWPSPIQPAEYSPFGAITTDLIVGKVVTTFSDTGYRPTGALNHLSTSTNENGTLIRNETYFDQKTGIGLIILMTSVSNNPSTDYTITFAMQTSNVLTISSLTNPPLLTMDVLQPGPISLITTSSLTWAQATELMAVGTGVIAFSTVAAFLVPKAIEFATAKASEPESPFPKMFKDFFKKYAAKKFENFFKSATRRRKKTLITPKEIGVLLVGVLIIALINAFVSVDGYPGILDASAFSLAFLFALISAFIVQTVSFFGDTVTSFGSWTQKELKFWSLGSLTWIFSGLLARVPFSSPSISKTLGATSSKLKQEKKISALNAVTKALILLCLFIPFDLMATNSTLSRVGTTGLLTTVVLFCCALLPMPPLGGKDIYAYRKKTSVMLAFASAVLMVFTYLGVISYWSFLIVGVVAVAALPIVLVKASAEKAKMRQVYVDLWFN